MTDMQTTTIACVAHEWTRLHAEARRLKHERNACLCDFEGQRDHGTRVEPCFKNFCIERAEDPPTTLPVAEWCPSCQRRDVIHRQLRETRKRAGIANRRLQALCRGALKGGAR
jgi:hypothetical protein